MSMVGSMEPYPPTKSVRDIQKLARPKLWVRFKMMWRSITKYLFIVTIALLSSGLCYAQTANQFMVPITGAPAGSCPFLQMANQDDAVALWWCSAFDGAWHQFGGGGGGTVTSFSSGNLSPLFTTSVANPNTTPALSFALSNAAAFTLFGNNTNASAAPSYTTMDSIFGSCSTATNALTFNTTTHLFGCNTTTTGTVTSITASSPLTGGTITGSGSIGCQASSGIQDGCLSSTDWGTFNGKQTALSSNSGATHKFFSAFTAPNTFTVTQPACGDLSDAASGCSTAALATPVTVTNGGTGAAPGADDQVLVSDSTIAATWRTLSGGAVKYTTATNTFAQAACADLSNGATGCSTTVGTAATHAATDFATAGAAVAGGTCTNQAATAISTNGVPTCTTLTSAYTSGTFPATAHNLLSATHGDTTASAAVRGGGIFALGASPTWTQVAHSAATGGYFKWNGTDIVSSTGAAAGTGACTNQAVTAENADGAPTCTTLTSAYVDTSIALASATLTANQLLFGNGTNSIKVGNLTGDVTTAGGTATTIAHTYPAPFGTTTAPGCANGGGTTTFIGRTTSSTTETAVIRMIAPEAYVVSKLYVNLGGNVPASQSLAVAVMDATNATSSGSAQTVTCTIAAGAAVCNDTAHSFTTTAGHAIDIRFVCTGGTSALTAPVHIELGMK